MESSGCTFDDLDVLAGLQNNGLQYLTEFIKNCKLNEETKERIRGYLEIYITDDAIVENGMDSFINYIRDGQDNNLVLWSIMEDKLNNDEIKKYMSKIFGKKLELSFEDKINMVINFISSKRVQRAMCDDELYDFEDGIEIQNSFLGLIFDGVRYERSNEWINDIIKIHKVFYKLVVNKELRPYIVKWFADVFNLNTPKINLDFEDCEYDDLSTDDFLTNIVGLLIIFWNKGVNDNHRSPKREQLKKIDITYIKYKDCPINWYDKNEENDIKNSDISFLTQLFFLILNGLRVGYIPILYRANNWDNLLETLEYEKSRIINSRFANLSFSQLALKSLDDQIGLTKKYVLIDKKIKENQHVHNLVNIFYNNWLVWHNEFWDEELIVDDILYDISYFLQDRQDRYENKDLVPKFIIDLTAKIISDDKYTKNPDIRFEFLRLLDKFLLNNNIFLDGKVFIKSVLNFIVSIDKHQKDEPVETFTKKIFALNTFKILINIFGPEPETRILGIILDEINFNTKKFANIILNDIMWLGETIDNLIKLTKDATLDAIIRTKKAKLLHEILGYHFNIINMINFMLLFPIFREIFSKDEIITTIPLILNTSLRWIVDDLDFKFPFLKIYSGQYNPNDNIIAHLIQIVNLYLQFKNNNVFLESTINDFKEFDIDRFHKIICKLNDSQLIKEINNFITILIKQIEKMACEDNIEYPEEFLDPLTFMKIENPVMLPGMDNVFMEKRIIQKHLLNDETNPFTRDNLTIKMLEEYNNKPDIVNKINDFKNRMDDWKTK